MYGRNVVYCSSALCCSSVAYCILSAVAHPWTWCLPRQKERKKIEKEKRNEINKRVEKERESEREIEKEREREREREREINL